jgi:flagellar hook-basal body complex protein FliE
MSTLTTLAADAYSRASQLGGLKDAAPAASAPTGAGPSFSSLIRDSMNEAEAVGKSAEAQAAAHLAGKGELIDVVSALTAAQTSLETVVAVRDRVISAYQEISRMPI